MDTDLLLTNTNVLRKKLPPPTTYVMKSKWYPKIIATIQPLLTTGNNYRTTAISTIFDCLLYLLGIDVSQESLWHPKTKTGSRNWIKTKRPRRKSKQKRKEGWRLIHGWTKHKPWRKIACVVGEVIPISSFGSLIKMKNHIKTNQLASFFIHRLHKPPISVHYFFSLLFLFLFLCPTINNCRNTSNTNHSSPFNPLPLS